jgi:hypothetical protein
MCCHRSGAIHLSSAEFIVEPRFSLVPLAHHRDRPDLQDLCRLLHAQPAEVAQLHNLALTRIESGQGSQRIIERYQIGAALGRDFQRLVERDLLKPGFAVRLALGITHQDVAHQPGRDPEEVRAILPFDILPIN